MGKFEIYQSEKSSDFYFRLKAGNGEIILASQGYASKEACKGGIESCHNHSQDKANYEVKTSTDGKTFFNLKASNGQVIGKSEMYEATSGADNGIASVMKNCAECTTIDLTT